MPTLSARTSPPLSIAEAIDRVYLLAIMSNFVGVSELEVQHNLFTSEEYLVLIVYVDEREGDRRETVKSVQGLVLSQFVVERRIQIYHIRVWACLISLR